jgi:RND superfamily putative drug exporter
MKLRKVFADAQPDASYLPTEMMSQGDMAQLGASLITDVNALSASLSTLSQAFVGKNAYLYSESLLSLSSGAEDLGKVFFSSDATATRLYVILTPEPYSNEALKVSDGVRQAAEQSIANTGLGVYISGSSAAFADIQQISGEDFVRVLILTAAGVLLVMMILLRSVAAPLYLVLTVLLSYGSTLSLTVVVFQILLGQGGLNLLIPTMILVLLVALGADYNIFLMSRVREETTGKNFVEGLVSATSRTGAIITSCGIVLAGTFATMMLSPMSILLQVGAAVAFGVLLDTFVIRGMLVPAIARLLQRRNWWPSRR